MINRLSKIGRADLLHNVYLLAGATFISKKNTKKVRRNIASTVAGRVTNVYCKNDTAL